MAWNDFLPTTMVAFKWFTFFMSSIVGHREWNRYYVYERIYLVSHRYLIYMLNNTEIHTLVQIALCGCD